MANVRKNPKPQVAWGYYNWGTLWGVRYRRRDAIEEIERIIGKPWSEAKRSCEVHKVMVQKLPAAIASAGADGEVA